MLKFEIHEFSTLCQLFMLSFDFFFFSNSNFSIIFFSFLDIPSECQLNPDQARSFVGPDLGPNCLQKLLTGKAKIIIIMMLALCTLVNHKHVLWQKLKPNLKCRIKYGISPGSTLFANFNYNLQRNYSNLFGNYSLLPLPIYNGSSQVCCIKPDFAKDNFRGNFIFKKITKKIECFNF